MEKSKVEEIGDTVNGDILKHALLQFFCGDSKRNDNVAQTKYNADSQAVINYLENARRAFSIRGLPLLCFSITFVPEFYYDESFLPFQEFSI